MTRNEFNICIFKPTSSSIIQTYSYKEIKEYIEKSAIVPIQTGSKRLAYKDNEGKVKIGIPKTKKNIHNDLFWDILSKYKGLKIPTKDTYLGWAAVFGGNVDFSWINMLLKI